MKAEQLEVSDLLALAGRQQYRWQWAAATTTLERVLSPADGRARGTPLQQLTARRMRAEIWRRQGDFTGAYREAVDLVHECEARYGPAHPATVRAAFLAGAVAHDLGLLDEAERRYWTVAKADPDQAGPAGRAVRMARAGIALVYRDRGEVNKAMQLLTACHTDLRRAYGPEDIDVLRLTPALAELQRRVADETTARRSLTVAYANAQNRLGPGHPLTCQLELELTAVETPMPATAPQEQPILEITGEYPTVRPAALLAAPARPRPAGATVGRPRRRAWIWIPVLAVAAAAVTVALTWPTQVSMRAPATPIPSSGPAPAMVTVTLADQGRSVRLTWSIEGVEVVQGLVAVGPRPDALTVRRAINPTVRTYTVQGLVVGRNYCFQVLLTDGAGREFSSVPTCTRREHPTAGSSR